MESTQEIETKSNDDSPLIIGSERQDIVDGYVRLYIEPLLLPMIIPFEINLIISLFYRYNKIYKLKEELKGYCTMMNSRYDIWVRRGVDCNTGREFAFKFIERYKDEQGELLKSIIRRVETEIDVLRKVGKHDNIIRLFAYNLKQEYPDRNQSKREVILLVLEYTLHGSLFDILYYTEYLEPILARTYFKQLCAGVECLHSNGIIHRNLKARNLLLDQHYNLKIADFSSSKVVNIKNVPDNDLRNYKCLNPRRGTKGYQAPEIVSMNKKLKQGLFS